MLKFFKVIKTGTLLVLDTQTNEVLQTEEIINETEEVLKTPRKYKLKRKFKKLTKIKLPKGSWSRHYDKCQECGGPIHHTEPKDYVKNVI